MPIGGVRIDPGERRRLTVTFRRKEVCDAPERGGSSGSLLTPGLSLAYRAYAVFHEEEWIELATTVTLLCGRDLPRADGWVVTNGVRSSQP